jgi:putative oxygen-independent coproporphyrinogen III oxidase
MLSQLSGPAGVYVHFPWCLQKCPYCDFVSFATERSAIDHRAYADAVLAEIEARRPALEGRRIATIFFGGGTPSLWQPDELGRVIARLREVALVDADAEITVECNPSSLDAQRAHGLRAAGANRLSVGVQGLDRERLAFLGRLHDETGGLRAVLDALASGIARVSADVIYGVAGGRPQSAEEAAQEVGRVADTGVTHLSAYALTIEPSTVFGDLARKGTLPILQEDTVADAFLAVRAALEARGFVHYEVSNYARPGHEARHNLGYWRGLDYVGLGCAAYGTLSVGGGRARRYRNKTDPQRYMAEALAGRSPEGSSEDLSPETRLRERIMLGLRLAEGLDLTAAADALGVPAWTNERRRSAEKLLRKGLLSMADSRIAVPAKAWLFADGVAAELF